MPYMSYYYSYSKYIEYLYTIPYFFCRKPIFGIHKFYALPIFSKTIFTIYP